ncbi:MAG: hypothetical protein HYU74_12580 [Dechloromonas sp.]|nr:hypothetical protein [Dechloromonas sp.]
MSINALLTASTRRNGKSLLTPETAAALKAAMMPLQRIVNQDMTISLGGKRWFIPNFFAPGQRVFVSPTQQVDRLLIEFPSGDGPSIWAVPADSLHSPRCTGCTQYSAPNWGSGSTSREPSRPDESSDRAARPGAPRPAKAMESTHTRSADSAHTDRSGRSIAIHLTVHIQPSCLSNSSGSDN